MSEGVVAPLMGDDLLTKYLGPGNTQMETDGFGRHSDIASKYRDRNSKTLWQWVYQITKSKLKGSGLDRLMPFRENVEKTMQFEKIYFHETMPTEVAYMGPATMPTVEQVSGIAKMGRYAFMFMWVCNILFYYFKNLY